MTIKLELSVEEINQLLGVLGDQPIKSGLSTLTTKIKTQGDAQVLAGQGTAAEVVDVDVVS